jgi:F0F1-type ATP synthase assembly protein I
MPAPKSSRGEGDLKWVGLLQVGMALVGSIALGYFLGAWLDKKWGSSPWAVVGGVVLGSLGGFVHLFRTISRTTK